MSPQDSSTNSTEPSSAQQADYGRLFFRFQIPEFFALSFYNRATDAGSTMLEMAIGAVLVTMAVVAIGGRSINAAGSMASQDFVLLEETSDLPCPWCHAQTREGDAHCATCGQRFG